MVTKKLTEKKSTDTKEEKIVKKARVKLEKLDIIKDAMSVGVDIQKYKTQMKREFLKILLKMKMKL